MIDYNQLKKGMFRCFSLPVSTKVYKIAFAKAPFGVSAKSQARLAVAKGRIWVSQ